MDLSGAVLTDHAMDRLRRRGIDPEAVRTVLASPEEVLPEVGGRVVAQSMMSDGAHLLRVFVDTDCRPFEVVSAYRTSKIRKYRRRP